VLARTCTRLRSRLTASARVCTARRSAGRRKSGSGHLGADVGRLVVRPSTAAPAARVFAACGVSRLALCVRTMRASRNVTRVLRRVRVSPSGCPSSAGPTRCALTLAVLLRLAQAGAGAGREQATAVAAPAAAAAPPPPPPADDRVTVTVDGKTVLVPRNISVLQVRQMPALAPPELPAALARASLRCPNRHIPSPSRPPGLRGCGRRRSSLLLPQPAVHCWQLPHVPG